MNFNLFKTCRVCKSIETTNKFSLLAGTKAEMFKDIVGVMVDGSESDSMICQHCFSDLERSHDFKTKALQSEEDHFKVKRTLAASNRAKQEVKQEDSEKFDLVLPEEDTRLTNENVLNHQLHVYIRPVQAASQQCGQLHFIQHPGQQAQLVRAIRIMQPQAIQKIITRPLVNFQQTQAAKVASHSSGAPVEPTVEAHEDAVNESSNEPRKRQIEDDESKALKKFKGDSGSPDMDVEMAEGHPDEVATERAYCPDESASPHKNAEMVDSPPIENVAEDEYDSDHTVFNSDNESDNNERDPEEIPINGQAQAPTLRNVVPAEGTAENDDDVADDTMVEEHLEEEEVLDDTPVETIEDIRVRVDNLLKDASFDQLRQVEALLREVIQVQVVEASEEEVIEEYDESDFTISPKITAMLKGIFKKTRKGGRQPQFELDVFNVDRRVTKRDIQPLSKPKERQEVFDNKCLFCEQTFEKREHNFKKHIVAHLICYQCPDPKCWDKDANDSNTLFGRPETYSDHIDKTRPEGAHKCAGFKASVPIRLPVPKQK